MNPKFGGLDLAQRVDNSALVVLELDSLVDSLVIPTSMLYAASGVGAR